MGISTVAGNYPIDVTTKNARKVLELLGSPSIPVAQGMSKPLSRPLPSDPFSHGSDGMGETFLPEPSIEISSEHACDQIIRTVSENPGEITIVCLGPLSNIGLALIKAPEVMANVAEIVCIAGAYGLNEYAFSNATGATPQSEWNVYVDPEAAKVVFESGIPVRAIGLDVATHFDVNFSEEELTTFKASPRAEANLVERMVRFVQSRGFQSYCVLIDSMAVAAVIDPSIIETVKVRVGVETEGKLTLGQTVADFRHHHAWGDLPEIEVAKTADFRRFLDLVISSVSGA